MNTAYKLMQTAWRRGGRRCQTILIDSQTICLHGQLTVSHGQLTTWGGAEAEENCLQKCGGTEKNFIYKMDGRLKKIFGHRVGRGLQL